MLRIFLQHGVVPVREIPSFKNKMQELKDKPVKFTFINLDEKEIGILTLKTLSQKTTLQGMSSYWMEKNWTKFLFEQL
jgi:hypothetical protein